MHTVSLQTLIGVFLIGNAVAGPRITKGPAIPGLEYLNEKVDPCENFYEFTCGNFKNVNPLPEGSRVWDHFAILQTEIHKIAKEILNSPRYLDEPVALQKAKAFYTGCLNVEAMEGAGNGFQANIDFLNKLHQWPAITIDYDDTEAKFSWNYLADLAAEYGLTFLFSFKILPSTRNESSYVIYIQRDELKNPDASSLKPDIFLDDLDYLGDNKAVKVLPYFEFLKNIAFYLRDNTAYYTPNEYVVVEIEETIQYMRTVSKNGVVGSETLPTLDREMSVEQLQKWTDEVFGSNFIDWLSYLNRVIKDKDVVVTKDTLIMQLHTNIMYGLLNLYKVSSSKQLKNYVIARLLTHMAPDSEKFMRNEWEKFAKANQNTIYSRENYCVRKTLGYSGNVDFSLAVTHEYQNTYFDKNKFTNIAEMIGDINNTFLEILENSDWMDEESLQHMKEKALKMVVLLGYPEDVVELPSELDTFYEDMKICSWDHFGNAQRLRSFQLAQTLHFIGERKRRDEWTLSPLEVNAFYNRGLNRILLPVSIFNNIFFTDEYSVLDYARIGSIFAHEITHGFDNSGRTYNAEGVLNNSWTPSTEKEYIKKATCFENQYFKYFIDEIGEYVNGTKSLNENLADNGGMRIAYKAFQKLKSRKYLKMDDFNYTAEQMLFIGFGTMWCSDQTPSYLEDLNNNNSTYAPNRYRVIGTVSNMPEFAEAFKCPLGSNMNPRDKCTLW